MTTPFVVCGTPQICVLGSRLVRGASNKRAASLAIFALSIFAMSGWLCAPAAIADNADLSSTPPVGAPPPAQNQAMTTSDALFADDPFDPLAPEIDGAAVHDPFEPMNRRIFRGNRLLDRFVLDPVTKAYSWAMPDPGKRAVRGVFENLGEPGVMVNDLLQGNGKKAGLAGTRFVVNSTVGVAGLWDPAEKLGIAPHRSDFGQTLGRAGLRTGPYLMLPVFGPNTPRDLVGDAVDLALRPDTWLLPFASVIVVGSTDGISIKEETREELAALEESSVDFYAALRSAYTMHREAVVRNEADADPVVPQDIPTDDAVSSKEWEAVLSETADVDTAKALRSERP